MGIPYSLFGKNNNSKRPRDDEDGEDDEESHSSVKKRLRTTDYIYQQLFVNGASSDITICALGEEWKLHKIYLSQSPYFSSMFNGAWKEAKQGRIHISVPNKMITMKSLDQVFGSLYRDEIEIDSSEVTRLVAAATLLQLDYLISQCNDVMCENIRFRNVIPYLVCSEENGLHKVKKECIHWLQRNLLRYSNDARFLRSINKDLMISLVSSNDLLAIQGEIDIYYLLKKWTFVRLKKKTGGLYKVYKDKSSLKVAADKWFETFRGQPQSFLETQSGREFIPVFSALRLHNILVLDKCLQSIIDDNIVQRRTIEKCMALKWQMQMCVESEFEEKEKCNDQQDIDESDFYKSAIRCGRVIQHDTPHCWRWSGVNHGVDVLMTCRHRIISVKRNCTSHPCPYSVNFKPVRTIHYRLDAFSFDHRKQVTWSLSTGISKAVLKADEVQSVLKIPDDVHFPLTLAFWYVVTPVSVKSSQILSQYTTIWSTDNSSYADWTNEQCCSSSNSSSFLNLSSFTGDSPQSSSSSSLEDNSVDSR